MLIYGMETHGQLYCLPHMAVVTKSPLGRDVVINHVGQQDIMYCDYHIIQSQLMPPSSDSIPGNTDSN